MSEIYREKPLVKVVMLKGADGTGSKLSELENDADFLTKEEIITLVKKLVSGSSVSTLADGCVTTVKETNHSKGLKFWYGTKAEYSALSQTDDYTYYIITDDTLKTELTAQIAAALQEAKSYTDTAAATASADITELQTTVDSIESAIEELKNSIKTNASTLTALQTNVSGNISNGNSSTKRGSYSASNIIPLGSISTSSGGTEPAFYVNRVGKFVTITGGFKVMSTDIAKNESAGGLLLATMTKDYIPTAYSRIACTINGGGTWRCSINSANGQIIGSGSSVTPTTVKKAEDSGTIYYIYAVYEAKD